MFTTGPPHGPEDRPHPGGSSAGAWLDRKARARKDPKAHGGFKANQACSCTCKIYVGGYEDLAARRVQHHTLPAIYLMWCEYATLVAPSSHVP